jgi:hypothetical protein
MYSLLIQSISALWKVTIWEIPALKILILTTAGISFAGYSEFYMICIIGKKIHQ